MRKLFVSTFLICTFFSFNANAQSVNPSTNLLSFGATYYGSKKDGISDKLLGGELNFSHAAGGTGALGGNFLYASGQAEGSSVKTTIISIQPEFRNYFGKTVFKGVYLAINAEYQHVKSTWGTGSGAVGNNFGVGAGLGFNPQFSERLSGSLKGAVGYIFTGEALRWNLGLGLAFKI